MQSELLQLQEELREATAQQAVSAATLQSWQQRLEHLEGEKMQLSQRADVLQSLKDEAEQQTAEALSKSAGMSQTLALLRQQVDGLRSEKQELKLAQENSKGLLATAASAQEDLRHDSEGLRHELKEALSQKQQLESEAKQVRAPCHGSYVSSCVDATLMRILCLLLPAYIRFVFEHYTIYVSLKLLSHTGVGVACGAVVDSGCRPGGLPHRTGTCQPGPAKTVKNE